MGNLSDISETTVQKKEKILDKTSSVSETGAGAYSIDYQLCVNPYGNDLDPKSNTLLLSDNLSIDQSDSETVFDPSALRVYLYDASKDDKIGQELNQNRYTVQFDSKSHKLVLTVPDSLALVVKYRYSFRVGANDTTVSNSASLNGVAGGDSLVSNILKTTESGASAFRKILKFIKLILITLILNFRVYLSNWKSLFLMQPVIMGHGRMFRQKLRLLQMPAAQ